MPVAQITLGSWSTAFRLYGHHAALPNYMGKSCPQTSSSPQPGATASRCRVTFVLLGLARWSVTPSVSAYSLAEVRAKYCSR